jgi:phage-related minor tail protein
MAAGDSVFQDIKSVLEDIEDVVTSSEFTTARDLVKTLPGLSDVWEAITDGLGVVFGALETALNAIKDQASNLDPVIGFATNLNLLLDQVSGLITGGPSDTLQEVKNSVGTISGISADVVTLINDIIALIGTIKTEIEIS